MAEHDRCQDDRQHLVGAQRQQAIAHHVYADRQVMAATVHGRGEQLSMDRITNRQHHARVERQYDGHQGGDYDLRRIPSAAAQEALRQSGAEEHAHRYQRQAETGVAEPVDDTWRCAWLRRPFELVQQAHP